MPLKRAFFNKFACKLKIRNTFLIKIVHVGLHDVANAAKIKTTENTFTLFNYFFMYVNFREDKKDEVYS